MDAALAIDFLSATVRIATPILMAAMGGILIERAGTFAVGLEGMMLSGAFSGVVGAYLSGSIVIGLVAACIGGLVFGAIIAVATTRFDTEHTPACIEAGSAIRRCRPSTLRLGYFRGWDASHIRMTRSSKALS